MICLVEKYGSANRAEDEKRSNSQSASRSLSSLICACIIWGERKRGGGGEGRKKRLEWNGLEDGMGRKYRDAEVGKRPKYFRGTRPMKQSPRVA